MTKRQAISTEGIFRSYQSSTYELKTPSVEMACDLGV